jgi:hypothetical protein
MTREQATTARRAWARVLIRRAVDPPVYGSPEWLALDDQDPRKVAAVVAAAECWAQEGDDLEDRLRRELAARWHAEKQAEDAEYVAATREHRARWERLGRAWPHPPYKDQPMPPHPPRSLRHTRDEATSEG